MAIRKVECFIINKVCLKELLTDDGKDKARVLREVLRKQGQYFSKKAFFFFFFSTSGSLRDKNDFWLE